MGRRWLLVAMIGLMSGCAGGGGGGQAASPTPAMTTLPSPGGIPADLSRDLLGESRDYVEAYARAPWVHANAASGEWGKAESDLKFIRDRMADLAKDEDVSDALKARLARLNPLLERLTAQIAAQRPEAMLTSAELVMRFSTLTNEPAIQGWLGREGGGGGGPVSPSP